MVTVSAALLLLLGSAPPTEFASASQGLFASASVQSSPAGDAALFELGGASVGLKSFRGRAWLLAWDARLAGTGGLLVSGVPPYVLLGGRASARAEAARRMLPGEAWSPSVALGAAADLAVLAPPGLSWTALNTLNDLSGVGGLNATGFVRLPLGVSWLSGNQSLLIEVFGQELLRAESIDKASAAFAGGGASLRFDLAQHLMATLEGFVGVAPTRADRALNLTDQTLHAEAAAMVRHVFSNGMWIEAALSASRDSDTITYVASGTRYATASAPVFQVKFDVGYPLGPQG